MRQDGRLYNPYRKVYSQESAVEDEDEDQYVKCVKIEIEEREARVTDVATGSGHILVVAEVEAMAKVERAVFAAGQGESGQLGVGGTPKFVDEFTEVRELRGKKVRSLVCAGWSSWVVVESEAG
ncbi:hypothetical protein K469DRAFT_717929 [Zopfia rhizophila CBS 207.26]|uniref:Uncharacterized protein n=1 Tax=Zopfia rhizophila CBS 207.26 TaxID=1314779 RepID=A0A6A6DGS0_9PEZI|nr:hypothetical protein K469DRAFT_717929 [Zopfia rhizophila CBS 207.26]